MVKHQHRQLRRKCEKIWTNCTKQLRCVLRSHLQDDTRAFSHYVAVAIQTPRLLLLWAGSASSYDGFVLPRPLQGLLMQSVRKSSDIKYNRGERSRKSYRTGMNSFPFELVPFSFNLLLSASSWPESSLCFSSTPEGSTESAAHWPHLCEPNTCSVLQVLQSIPYTAAGLSLIHINANTAACCHGKEITVTLKEAAIQNH